VWRRLLALVRKELLVFLQDPRARIVVLAPPLIQLVIFAYAASFDLDRVALGVLDEDRTALSRALTARIAGAPAFAVRMLEREADIRPAIDDRRLIGVLRIREGFAGDLLAGRPARVQLLLDGRQSNTALTVLGYLQRIVADFRPPAAAMAPAPPRIEVRAWFNPNLESRWYVVPALVAMITMVSVIGVTGLAVARERELGTLEQLLVTPLRPAEIALGKLLPGVFIGLLQAAFTVAVAVRWFGVPLRGDIATLVLALAVFALAVAGVGLLISALARTQQQAMVGLFFFTAPASILSGFATPVANMPDWLQLATLANPLRYMIAVVRGVFLRGLGLAELWGQIWPMAVIALSTLALAAVVFRRRLA